MRLSFIIPAFNEEKHIRCCLKSIEAATAANPDSGVTEIIVTDNNSTDLTAQIATEMGATVVFEPVNQISRARNTGATRASGEWLIFIDADSELNSELLREVLGRINSGAILGCGSLMKMDDVPFWGRCFLSLWTLISRRLNWAAGSFIVCRHDIFKELGGFNEKLFAAEEVELSRRLKHYGHAHKLRFEVLTEHPLKTSNRKMHLYSGWETFIQLCRLIFMPRKSLMNKESLSIWYDGRR